MKRSLVLSSRVWTPLPAMVLAAEAAGFSRVWTTEGPRRDALVRAAALLAITSRIAVGSGIAFAFSRNPLALAGAAADLALISGGRFTLGLGAGTRGVRRQYGVDIDKVAPWFEEVVAVVRQGIAATSQGVSFDGQYFKVKLSGARLADVAEAPPEPPIFGGALNPIMVQRVAKCCDGLALLSIGIGQPYFEDVVMPAFRRGRERAGKSAVGGLTCWIITAVDGDRERARLMARRQLAFYFSTPSYRAPSDALGFQVPVQRLQDQFRASGANWDRLADLIPDEMVDAFTVAGTPAEARQQLNQFEARLAPMGVDELALQLPTANLDDDGVDRLSRAVIKSCAPSAGAAA